MPNDITALSTLAERLRACVDASAGIAPPAAVLFCDPGGEFAPVLPALRDALPELRTLGAYEPDTRTGPAIWLRCEIDGDELDRPPIVLLPEIRHETLAAGEKVPEGLLPLVELLYRGTRWKQSNGKDWTLRGFLASKAASGGAGLRIAEDAATAAALRNAAAAFFKEPLEGWSKRRLTAADFDGLLSGDEVRTMLDWLNDADTLGAMTAERRAAFAGRARERFAFDPEKEDRLAAAARFARGAGEARGAGGWADAWERFAENPARWPNVHDTLLPVQREGLFKAGGHYPSENAEGEKILGEAIKSAVTLPVAEARAAVLRLEADHAGRRAGPWAAQGKARWAEALGPLAVLARGTSSALSGGDREAMAEAYRGGGWEADAAALEALAGRKRPQAKPVAALVKHLLCPWQEEAALRFQSFGETTHDAAPIVPPAVGCLLFADGLRYDVGQRLGDRLEAAGHTVERRDRWAALPTVTATAKPAASPAAAEVSGGSLPETFAPHVAATGKLANAAELRKAIAAKGFTVIAGGEEPPAPRSDQDRAWIETGEIDSDAHKSGMGLVDHLNRHLDDLTHRVEKVFEAGWTSVRIVTDHGWLLMPGGLPRADLPKHATQSRWARCAALAAGADPGVPTAPWHWNPAERFAHAPGIACFNKSEVYAHGGLSLQECLTPDLLVRPAVAKAAPSNPPTIVAIRWRRQRCDVEVTDFPAGATVSLGGVSKEVEPDGHVTLLVGDEDLAGQTVSAELRDAAGVAIARRDTVVGG